MKKRAISLIIGLIATAGVTIYNYTGEDVVLENGETVSTKELVTHITKEYGTRNLKDSLYITIHCSAGPKNQKIENIAAYHVNDRGWPGVGYHSAINYDGDIFLLNDLEKVTYHNAGENTISIGICFIGNYDEYILSDEQIDSLKLLLDALCKTLPIKGIRGHRDVPGANKTCPGNYAYKQLTDEGIFF